MAFIKIFLYLLYIEVGWQFYIFFCCPGHYPFLFFPLFLLGGCVLYYIFLFPSNNIYFLHEKDEYFSLDKDIFPAFVAFNDVKTSHIGEIGSLSLLVVLVLLKLIKVLSKVSNSCWTGLVWYVLGVIFQHCISIKYEKVWYPPQTLYWRSCQPAYFLIFCTSLISSNFWKVD